LNNLNENRMQSTTLRSTLVGVGFCLQYLSVSYSMGEL
jgi:hypothetical protein